VTAHERDPLAYDTRRPSRIAEHQVRKILTSDSGKAIQNRTAFYGVTGGEVERRSNGVTKNRPDFVSALHEIEPVESTRTPP
jgi:hypothetical protein